MMLPLVESSHPRVLLKYQVNFITYCITVDSGLLVKVVMCAHCHLHVHTSLMEYYRLRDVDINMLLK